MKSTQTVTMKSKNKKSYNIKIAFTGDIANAVRVRHGKIHLNLSKLPLYWMETFRHRKKLYAIVKIEDRYAQLFQVKRAVSPDLTGPVQAQK